MGSDGYHVTVYHLSENSSHFLITWRATALLTYLLAWKLAHMHIYPQLGGQLSVALHNQAIPNDNTRGVHISPVQQTG